MEKVKKERQPRETIDYRELKMHFDKLFQLLHGEAVKGFDSKEIGKPQMSAKEMEFVDFCIELKEIMEYYDNLLKIRAKKDSCK